MKKAPTAADTIKNLSYLSEVIGILDCKFFGDKKLHSEVTKLRASLENFCVLLISSMDNNLQEKSDDSLPEIRKEFSNFSKNICSFPQINFSDTLEQIDIFLKNYEANPVKVLKLENLKNLYLSVLYFNAERLS